MIPKSRKIRRALFPSYNTPKYTWVGQTLRIQCYKDKTPILSRFAVVVSKRSYRNIPERNHFKRVVLSLISRNTGFFDGLPFAYYVILPKKVLNQITSSEILTDITDFYNEQKSREIRRN